MKKGITAFWSKHHSSSAEVVSNNPQPMRIDYDLLIEAVNQGNIEQVKLLLANGISVNTVNRDGRTALHQACVYGKFDLINVLLDTGADPLAKNIAGEIPFHISATYGHLAILKLLMARTLAPATLITSKDEDGRTALHKAAFCSDPTVCQYLIAQGSNVNALTNYNYSALHFAARSGHIDVAQALLSAGANPILTTVNKDTAAMIAKQFNHLILSQQLEAAAIRYFVQHPPNLNTPLLPISIQTSPSISILSLSDSNNNSPLLSPKRQQRYTHIGDRYALINKINRKEAQILYHQTGLRSTFQPNEEKIEVVMGRGKGNFGKFRLARHLQTGQFLGVKKIKGAEAIAQSEKEADIQRLVNGKEYIMPLLDAVKSIGSDNQPVLYNFMPIASVGDGDDIRQRLSQIDNHIDQERFLIHIAKALLSGLRNLHQAQVYHLDIKPSNWVMDQTGKGYIIDFGCAFNNVNSLISGGSGDTNYFSPERLANSNEFTTLPHVKHYDAAKADAWAAGLSLLEIAKGTNPLMGIKTKTSQVTTLQQFQVFFTIPELNNPAISSIWVVIKGLLEINPEVRLSVSEALMLPVFQRPANALDQPALQRIIQQLQYQAEGIDALQEFTAIPPVSRKVLESSQIEEFSHYGVKIKSIVENEPTSNLSIKP